MVVKGRGIGLGIAILWVIAGILIIVLPNVLNWLLGLALVTIGVLSYFKDKSL